MDDRSANHCDVALTMTGFYGDGGKHTLVWYDGLGVRLLCLPLFSNHMDIYVYSSFYVLLPLVIPFELLPPHYLHLKQTFLED